MAEREFVVRAGSAEDVPGVVALLGASLAAGAVPRTEEFWAWKHRENPFGVSPFWVAEFAGAIVGVRVFMRWTWTTANETVAAVRAVDTATRPDFQGKGIFRSLTLHGAEELARQGTAFVFNTPNEKSRPGYLKMGWSRVGRISLWIAPRRPGRVARVALSRLRHAQTPSLPEEDSAGDFASRSVLDGTEVARLVASDAAPDERYRTGVDMAYLRWRYATCPAVRYGFTLGDEGRMLVIHRTRVRSGAREVAICELLLDPERSTVRGAAHALRSILASKVADYAVVAPPSSARHAAVLALAGFVPAPRAGPLLTVRPLALGRNVPNPLSRRSWNPTLGAFELF